MNNNKGEYIEKSIKVCIVKPFGQFTYSYFIFPKMFNSIKKDAY